MDKEREDQQQCFEIFRLLRVENRRISTGAFDEECALNPFSSLTEKETTILKKNMFLSPSHRAGIIMAYSFFKEDRNVSELLDHIRLILEPEIHNSIDNFSQKSSLLPTASEEDRSAITYKVSSTYHIVHLYAEPLTLNISMHKAQTLNFSQEIESILSVAQKSSKSLSVLSSIMTPTTFNDVLNKGCLLLHLSAHCDGDNIYMENDRELGSPSLQSKDTLLNLLKHSRRSAENHLETELRVVILSACTSLDIANAFTEAGVPHVIATNANVSDNGAIIFSTSFYQSLLHGSSVFDAFNSAVASMKMQHTARKSFATDANSFQLLPCSSKRHHRKVFENINYGLLKVQLSPSLPLVPPENFVGRSNDLLRALQLLSNSQNRVLLVTGEPSIGKSAFAKVLANYVSHRLLFKAGVYHVSLGYVYTMKAFLELIITTLRDSPDHLIAFPHELLLMDANSFDYDKVVNYIHESLRVGLKHGSMMLLVVDDIALVQFANDVKLFLADIVRNHSNVKLLLADTPDFGIFIGPEFKVSRMKLSKLDNCNAANLLQLHGNCIRYGEIMDSIESLLTAAEVRKVAHAHLRESTRTGYRPSQAGTSSGSLKTGKMTISSLNHPENHSVGMILSSNLQMPNRDSSHAIYVNTNVSKQNSSRLNLSNAASPVINKNKNKSIDCGDLLRDKISATKLLELITEERRTPNFCRMEESLFLKQPIKCELLSHHPLMHYLNGNPLVIRLASARLNDNFKIHDLYIDHSKMNKNTLTSPNQVDFFLLTSIKSALRMGNDDTIFSDRCAAVLHFISFLPKSVCTYSVLKHLWSTASLKLYRYETIRPKIPLSPSNLRSQFGHELNSFNINIRLGNNILKTLPITRSKTSPSTFTRLRSSLHSSPLHHEQNLTPKDHSPSVNFHSQNFINRGKLNDKKSFSSPTLSRSTSSGSPLSTFNPVSSLTHEENIEAVERGDIDDCLSYLLDAHLIEREKDPFCSSSSSSSSSLNYSDNIEMEQSHTHYYTVSLHIAELVYKLIPDRERVEQVWSIADGLASFIQDNNLHISKNDVETCVWKLLDLKDDMIDIIYRYNIESFDDNSMEFQQDYFNNVDIDNEEEREDKLKFTATKAVDGENSIEFVDCSINGDGASNNIEGWSNSESKLYMNSQIEGSTNALQKEILMTSSSSATSIDVNDAVSPAIQTRQYSAISSIGGSLDTLNRIVSLESLVHDEKQKLYLSKIYEDLERMDIGTKPFNLYCSKEEISCVERYSEVNAYVDRISSCESSLQIGSTNRSANLFYVLCSFPLLLNDVDRLDELATKAEQICRKLGAFSEAMVVCNTASGLFEEAGNYQKAIDFTLSSIRICAYMCCTDWENKCGGSEEDCSIYAYIASSLLWLQELLVKMDRLDYGMICIEHARAIFSTCDAQVSNSGYYSCLLAQAKVLGKEPANLERSIDLFQQCMDSRDFDEYFYVDVMIAFGCQMSHSICSKIIDDSDLHENKQDWLLLDRVLADLSEARSIAVNHENSYAEMQCTRWTAHILVYKYKCEQSISVDDKNNLKSLLAYAIDFIRFFEVSDEYLLEAASLLK